SLRDLDASVILANTYHLYLRPGTEILEEAGGIHRFMSWDRPVLTDSGGFQVYSLSELNRISEEGVDFRSHLSGAKHFLSPEDIIHAQASIGADIIMPLDECMPYPVDRSYAEDSTSRTLRWAKRSRDTLGSSFQHHGYQQRLFGIVQGSTFPVLRRESVERTVELDFPGYSIGGLAVGEPKEEMLDLAELCAGLLPADRPRYLMGVGFPEDLLRMVCRGIDMFDCVMPSRNARKGTLFTRKGRLVVRNAPYARDFEAVDPECACPCCRNYSRAYLRHLFKAGEILGMQLATLHNLYFYLDLMRKMREAILEGRLSAFVKDFFLDYEMATEK
ncbi:MAG: tRNA guanosine(34) transglycosylase Tgt, partial [Candidatus Krumholzibacteria bacterium]|nr:tRNA guanosine(34) transglycosylase Tgt [Candidatus Krumholzibacteria bacterium]